MNFNVGDRVTIQEDPINPHNTNCIPPSELKEIVGKEGIIVEVSLYQFLVRGEKFMYWFSPQMLIPVPKVETDSYTVSPEGFMTNQKNWASGLDLLKGW